MSSCYSLPVISSPPIDARVISVRRKRGQYATEGEPLVDLEVAIPGVNGRYVLTICATEPLRVLHCREVGAVVRSGQSVVHVLFHAGSSFGIFVAYRQKDSIGHAGRIDDRLVSQFGRSEVFKDIDCLRPGETFAEVIRERLSKAVAMVVVIGPAWANDSRLQDPSDLHREEIRTAIQRDIPILAVCVNGASVPALEQLPEDLRPMLRRMAVEVSDTRWEFDMGRVVSELEEILRQAAARDRNLLQWTPPW